MLCNLLDHYRFHLNYFSDAELKGGWRTEIEIDTRGTKLEFNQVVEEFNMDDQDQDLLQLAVQTK